MAMWPVGAPCKAFSVRICEDFKGFQGILDGFDGIGALVSGEVHLLSTKVMQWRQWHLQLHFSRRGQSEFRRMGPLPII